MAPDSDDHVTTRAERRETKKSRRRFPVHGGSLRTLYRNITVKRAAGKKK